jgi:hypothetical protein
MAQPPSPADAAPQQQEPPAFPPQQVVASVPVAVANVPTSITIDIRFLTARPWRTLMVVAVVCALIAVFSERRSLMTWYRTGGARPPVVYALNSVVPSTRCDRLTPEEIVNGTAHNGQINLRNIKASLLHWMQFASPDNEPLQGICARYLERYGVCYCIVNMVRTQQEPPNWMDMYNMEIIGTSPYMFRRNTERSVLCKNTIETVRFEEITVRWTNEEGFIREREVKGLAAQTIQQIDAVQRGEGSCQDSNTDAAIAMLTKKINDLRQDMMFGNPDTVAMLKADYAQQRVQAAQQQQHQQQLPKGAGGQHPAPKIIN